MVAFIVICKMDVVGRSQIPPPPPHVGGGCLWSHDSIGSGWVFVGMGHFKWVRLGLVLVLQGGFSGTWWVLVGLGGFSGIRWI